MYQTDTIEYNLHNLNQNKIQPHAEFIKGLPNPILMRPHAWRRVLYSNISGVRQNYKNISKYFIKENLIWHRFSLKMNPSSACILRFVISKGIWITQIFCPFSGHKKPVIKNIYYSLFWKGIIFPHANPLLSEFSWNAWKAFKCAAVIQILGSSGNFSLPDFITLTKNHS